jgi:hypothetical protein
MVAATEAFHFLSLGLLVPYGAPTVNSLQVIQALHAHREAHTTVPT